MSTDYSTVSHACAHPSPLQPPVWLLVFSAAEHCRTVKTLAWLVTHRVLLSHLSGALVTAGTLFIGAVSPISFPIATDPSLKASAPVCPLLSATHSTELLLQSLGVSQMLPDEAIPEAYLISSALSSSSAPFGCSS